MDEPGGSAARATEQLAEFLDRNVDKLALAATFIDGIDARGRTSSFL